MIESVIFDMDGVLIDSVGAVHRARTKILKEDYGIDIASVPDPHNEGHKGNSVRSLLAAVKEHTGITISEDEFKPKFAAMVYEDLKSSGTKVDPELLEFLQELKQHGVPLAVATSSANDSAEYKLRILGIKDFFQAIITADLITNHKPHPEAYLVAMEQLHAAPTKSFVFEDSSQGIEAGRAAGAHVIGVANYNAGQSTLPGTAMTINAWSDVDYQHLRALLM